MITEDYVSFEVAKLLKEKGFDEPCKVWYSEYTLQFCDKKYIIIQFDKPNRFRENYKFMCSAPTIQMAMKWLRKFHKLGIIGKPYITVEGIFYLFEIKEMNKDSVVNKKTKTGFDTYEQACEAGIKYCLENLI